MTYWLRHVERRSAEPVTTWFTTWSDAVNHVADVMAHGYMFLGWESDGTASAPSARSEIPQNSRATEALLPAAAECLSTEGGEPVEHIDAYWQRYAVAGLR